MTAVDFWEAYAADTEIVSGKSAYAFYHNSSQILSNSAPVKYQAGIDIYMFHYSRPDRPKNAYGNIPEVLYSGKVLIAYIDNPRSSVGGQRANDSSTGLYETILKTPTDSATFLREIVNFHNNSTTYCGAKLDFNNKEIEHVYHLKIGGLQTTGFWIPYELLIRHDTNSGAIGTSLPQLIRVASGTDFGSDVWTHTGVNSITENDDGTADLITLYQTFNVGTLNGEGNYFRVPDSVDLSGSRSSRVKLARKSSDLDGGSIIMIDESDSGHFFFRGQSAVNQNIGTQSGETMDGNPTTFGSRDTLFTSINDEVWHIFEFYADFSIFAGQPLFNSFGSLGSFWESISDWGFIFIDSNNNGTFDIKWDGRGTAINAHDNLEITGAVSSPTTAIFNNADTESKITKTFTVSANKLYTFDFLPKDSGAVGDLIVSISNGTETNTTTIDLSDAQYNDYTRIPISIHSGSSTTITVTIKGDGTNEAVALWLDDYNLYRRDP